MHDETVDKPGVRTVLGVVPTDPRDRRSDGQRPSRVQAGTNGTTIR